MCRILDNLQGKGCEQEKARLSIVENELRLAQASLQACHTERQSITAQHLECMSNLSAALDKLSSRKGSRHSSYSWHRTSSVDLRR